MQTYLVGIDPSAETFTASARPTLQEPGLAPHTFENTIEGFEALGRWLAREGISPEQAFVCVENTGVYGEALCYWLHEHGYRLSLLDPYKVWKAFGEGPKSDPIDSQKITEYGLRYRDRLQGWQPNEGLLEQVRVLLATREHLVEQKTATQNAQRALLRKAIQTPAANQALEETSTQLKHQIRVIEQEIRRLIEEQPRLAQMVALLMSAPGVGLLLSAHLLVLTQGFTRAVCYRSLAQYLGLAPNARRSGQQVRPDRSRRYGPGPVRKLLHLAARSLKTHHAVYRKYFQRKVHEGKPKALILNNIANEVLRVLCAMIKNKQPYIEGYQSVHPRLMGTCQSHRPSA